MLYKVEKAKYGWKIHIAKGETLALFTKKTLGIALADIARNGKTRIEVEEK